MSDRIVAVLGTGSMGMQYMKVLSQFSGAAAIAVPNFIKGKPQPGFCEPG